MGRATAMPSFHFMIKYMQPFNNIEFIIWYWHIYNFIWDDNFGSFRYY